jgi:tetratricopeptide (TPR) repeat protein
MRCTLAGLGIALLASIAPAQGVTTVAHVRTTVTDALARRQSAGFAATRKSLETVRVSCALSDSPAGCRSHVDYSLGYLFQTEGSRVDTGRDTLLDRAVEYYDSALAADPNNRAALYNKALSVRTLGTRASPESFLREAAVRDPARGSTYLALLGDYFWDQARWRDAVGAYRGALDADPDNAATRAALVQCYRRWRDPSVLPELLNVCDAWQVRFPESAADAYRAVVQRALAAARPGEEPELAARAIVKLVWVQDRFGDSLLARSPNDTSALGRWAPLLQFEAFLRTASTDSAPWWSTGDRRQSLARAALVRGSEASANGDDARAERLWAAGANLAARRSRESVDLLRELALLYSRRPEIDRGGGKFRRVEDQIFVEKGAALVSGDLEAAQRFHTTLFLIYSQRGTWRSPYPARNALDQLTWALRAADERATAEHFYQPLPELRERLATLLDSLRESRAGARDMAISAVRAWLDTDDPESAQRSARLARRLGADVQLTALDALIARRTRATGSCDRSTLATLEPAAFAARQRFKGYADCRANAAAFAIADAPGFTLVGIEDVQRFERVASGLLASVGMPPLHAGHLEPAQPDRDAIPVALATETVPRWLDLEPDERLALRAIVALGNAATGARMRVESGNIEITPGAQPIGAATLDRLRSLPGAKQVALARSPSR